VREPNFETVAVDRNRGTAFWPDPTKPAPYLLVVDDDRLVADTLGAILRDAGYAVAVSYDAETAIEMAEVAPPEVVVTDVGLPNMNGVELAFRLQQSISDCRVVLVTGTPEEATRLLSTRPEHDFRVFEKPIQPTELLKHVSELMGCNGQHPKSRDTTAD